MASLSPAATDLNSPQSIHKGHALSESCLTFSPKYVRRSAQRTISVLGQNDPGKIDRKKQNEAGYEHAHLKNFQSLLSNFSLLSTYTYAMTLTRNLSSLAAG